MLLGTYTGRGIDVDVIVESCTIGGSCTVLIETDVVVAVIVLQLHQHQAQSLLLQPPAA